MHMLHFHVEVNHHKTVMGFSLNRQTNETDPETNKSHILGSTFFLNFSKEEVVLRIPTSA